MIGECLAEIGSSPSETGGLFRRVRSIPETDPGRSSAIEDIWNDFGRECAVLVLDSSGFTRSTRDSGIVHFLSCIAKLRELLGNIFHENGCMDCRFSADNAYAEFETSEEALEAALRVQDAVTESTIEVCSGCVMKVCIGIGYGRVLLSNSEGVFGDQMNLASKLGEDVAGEGDILLTESAFRALPELRRSEFSEESVSISGVDFIFFRRK
jgi:adenylate cyclase